MERHRLLPIALLLTGCGVAERPLASLKDVELYLEVAGDGIRLHMIVHTAFVDGHEVECIRLRSTVIARKDGQPMTKSFGDSRGHCQPFYFILNEDVSPTETSSLTTFTVQDESETMTMEVQDFLRARRIALVEGGNPVSPGQTVTLAWLPSQDDFSINDRYGRPSNRLLVSQAGTQWRVTGSYEPSNRTLRFTFPDVPNGQTSLTWDADAAAPIPRCDGASQCTAPVPFLPGAIQVQVQR